MKYFFLAVLIFTAGACSTIQVLNAEATDNVDFKQYKTFGFYNVKASGDTVSALFSARVDLIKEAISKELISRGYMQSNNPELLVNIGIRVKEEVETRTTDWRTDGAPKYVGQRNYSWKSEEVEIGRYRKGTVVIHLVDAARNRMLWRGVVQGVIPDKEAGMQKEIQQGIQLLFEKYPVPVQH